MMDFLDFDGDPFFPEPFVESDDELLRFARRFIHEANGRLRVCRS